MLNLPSGPRWRRNPLITISPYQPSLSALKHSFPRHVTSKSSDHDPPLLLPHRKETIYPINRADHMSNVPRRRKTAFPSRHIIMSSC